MGTQKTEMLQGATFHTHQDATIEIFDYIEAYYNTHRKHSSLGSLPPSSFEAQFKHNNGKIGPIIRCISPRRAGL